MFKMKLKVLILTGCSMFSMGTNALAKDIVYKIPLVSNETQGGQLLAVGEREEMAAIRALTAGKKIATIATGWATNLAVTTDGTLFGVINPYDDRYNFKVFLKDTEGKQITSISAGNGHYLAATRGGVLIAHGDDSTGAVTGILKEAKGRFITSVAAGTDHSLALTSDGVLIAAGTSTSIKGILAQAKNKKIAMISAGAWSSMAVTNDGQLLAGGDDDSPQQGGYSTSEDILKQAKDQKIVAIDASFAGQLLAVTDSGTLLLTGNEEDIAKLKKMISHKETECKKNDDLLCQNDLRKLIILLAEVTEDDDTLKAFRQKIVHEKIISAAFGGGNGGSWSIHALSKNGKLYSAGSNARFIASLQKLTQDKTISAIAPGKTIGYDSILLIEKSEPAHVAGHN